MIILSAGGATMFGGWNRTTRGIFVRQIGITATSLLVTVDSVRRLQARTGLPRTNQVAGWVLLAVGFVHPWIYRKRTSNADLRLLVYFMAFAPLFVIRSISVEVLFYASYTLTIYLWTVVEPRFAQPLTASSKDGYRQLQLDDLRIAIFFLFFTQVAFFGTGNVASISSFYLEPVYRLVPIFSPFITAALLIFKIVAPYIVLSASFAKLNHELSLPPFSLFMIALSLTDVMTLTFFFRVRDQGSWLEIGQTISFFIISSLLLIWSAGVCSSGQWILDGTLMGKRKLH